MTLRSRTRTNSKSQIAGLLVKFLDRYQEALLPPPSQQRKASPPSTNKGNKPVKKAAAPQKPPAAGSKSKRKAQPPSPKAEAWSALFAAIEERLKNKSCALDDWQRAVSVLSAQQQLVGGSVRMIVGWFLVISPWQLTQQHTHTKHSCCRESPPTRLRPNCQPSNSIQTKRCQRHTQPW